ncbi:MAG: isoleucine--tRNA ligase [Candidatus Aureabacteria bacterium]|nr:isoleucine--tRNA ligase [Candidatus Auribacterota bacterium]
MEKKEYKATLNLPKTSFPMKASLNTREPLLLENWAKEDLYGKMVSLRKGREKFVLHDGPPYANGDIHMGHALNKTLKDIVVKYKTMRGFQSPYVPGWDCHGLPVEHQLFRELGIGKHQIDRRVFREKARDYALRYVSVQREQFKRLGIFADWGNPYLTLDPAYQAKIVECFGKLYLDGYIYRGLRPIHWCATCETALAEAEVEYDEHRSPSIYVAFSVVSGLDKAFPGLGEAELLIWTTTPWTLPANRAVAVRPEFEYSAVRVGARILIIAKELLDRVMADIGVKEFGIVGSCRGKALEKLRVRHPLVERESPIVFSEHVTLDQGTGCVHIAPGHGDEDYQVGRRYGLDVFAPVNEKGEFTKEAGIFAGLKVEDANGKIIEHLRSRGTLLASREVVHSYPHCWRCKNPIIFRATTQWFLGVDRKGLRERALAIIKSVQWIPERGQNRIGSMIENRPDWCLSRQRLWGVPLPILYCEACGEAIVTEGTLQLIRSAVAERGADVWFIEPAEAFIPHGFACPSCGGKEFRKEEDIIDVWFDSGISHQAVLAARAELGYPCALYLEGSDQHRGWFQTSLLTSIALRGDAPFSAVLTHGFIMDGEGKKMSKSAGNVIAPQGIIDRYGADILRLWVASVDYSVDVRISEEILDHLVDAYRRIRNTLRFLLGNLYDFSPERDSVPCDRMEEIDRWILSRTERLLAVVTNAYERYDFCEVYHQIYNFCAVDLSSLYLDILKDRLYTRAAASPERRSAQTAMKRILDILVKICAPILAFTAEDAWREIPGRPENQVSIHLSDWPIRDDHCVSEALEGEWEKLLEVRSEVSKALEVARQGGAIGNSLGARVTISCAEGDLLLLLEEKEEMLADLFIVSQVTVQAVPKAREGEQLSVTVLNAEGKKCGRCWRYSTSVGGNGDHPTICSRCVEVVD